MRRPPPLVASIALLVTGFLYLPLAGVAVYSVNSARRGLVWHGFTLDWYFKLFENKWILEAALNTLVLAVISTIFATVLGTVVGVGAMIKQRKGGKTVIPYGPFLAIAALLYLFFRQEIILFFIRFVLHR